MENLRTENATLSLKPQAWNGLTESKAPITISTTKINCSGLSADHFSTLASESFLSWNKKKPCRKISFWVFVFVFFTIWKHSFPLRRCLPVFPFFSSLNAFRPFILCQGQLILVNRAEVRACMVYADYILVGSCECLSRPSFSGWFPVRNTNGSTVC